MVWAFLLKSGKEKELLICTALWFERKRWDSNPRAREDYLISSQGRYDHFDTLPYLIVRIPNNGYCTTLQSI